MKRLVTILTLVVFPAACNTAPMTVSNFMFMCSFGQSHEGGCAGGGGCRQFEPVVSASYKALPDCLLACDAAYRDLRGGASCATRISKARRLCEKFCRSNYQGAE